MAISIKTQPALYSTGITLARNPVIYEFSGCSQANTYTFNLLYDFNSTNPTTIYTSVLRKPDVNNILRIDCSDMLHNLLYEELINKNINYSDYQITNYISGFTSSVYFRAALVEQSGATSGITISNVGLAMDGYITQGISDQYDTQNYTDNLVYDNNNIILSTITGSSTYEIPILENRVIPNIYIVKGSSVVYYKIGFYNTSGTFLSSQYSIGTIAGGLKYAALYNYNIQYTIDFSKPIYLDLLDGSLNLLNRYTFKVSNPCKSINDYTFSTFLNRFGVFERIYFDGRIDKELNTSFDTYKYDNGKRTYHKKLNRSKGKFIVNTGWIQENKNSLVQDLMLSEIIYFGYNYTSGSNQYVKTIPVVLTDTNIRYKTEKNDRLYFYTLTFEEAVDKIK